MKNIPELFNLNGKTAFVTGAASGIGQCIAIALAQAGADVCLFDRDEQGLARTRAEIAAVGRNALTIVGDVVNCSALVSAVAETQDRLGALGIAVNAAGIANANPAEKMPLAQFQQLIDINLTGIFNSCQAQASAMIAQSGGSIINIASMSGMIVNRGLDQAHYNASKAAVIHLSRSMAMEWVGKGIRVNALSPGYVATPMNTRPEMRDQTRVFESQTPIGRMASVEEMAGPVLFLASDASSYCTGINLVADGGFTCW